MPGTQERVVFGVDPSQRVHVVVVMNERRQVLLNRTFDDTGDLMEAAIKQFDDTISMPSAATLGT